MENADIIAGQPWRMVQLSRADRWHVCSRSGIPLYDDSPHGDDKPLIFDEDRAFELVRLYNAVKRCNICSEVECICEDEDDD